MNEQERMEAKKWISLLDSCYLGIEYKACADFLRRIAQEQDSGEAVAWISVNERLPLPYSINVKRFQGVLAFVEDAENGYGGYQQILFYGPFEYQDTQDDGELVEGFGWHYERDSEGDYDTLIFDMNGKVTHWMPLPEPPEAHIKGVKP